jgi:hypothetical protein
MSSPNDSALLAASELTSSSANSTKVNANDSTHKPDETANANVEISLTSNANLNLKTKSILPNCGSISSNKDSNNNRDTVFTLKKWNLVAMWSWDVECEVCAICRTPLMGNFLKRHSLI